MGNYTDLEEVGWGRPGSGAGDPPGGGRRSKRGATPAATALHKRPNREKNGKETGRKPAYSPAEAPDAASLIETFLTDKLKEGIVKEKYWYTMKII